MKKRFLLITLTLSFFYASSQEKHFRKNDYLKELVAVMQGNYTSEKQAASDTSYFNISLRMVPIWKDKGHYLYVEQALSKKQDQPYRVRIYKIMQREENEFISEIYTLKNEKEWIGKWNNPVAFDKLTAAEIEVKSGCEVVLKRVAKNKFVGQTGANSCRSDMRGASYATSKVTVSNTQIISWDQGFDKDGIQVWGAEKGGYIFDKQ